MSDSADEDSVTQLNTQLNRTMVLMEDAVDTLPPNHKRKSITINTKPSPSRTPGSSVKSRRSILKKSSKSSDNVTNEEAARPIGDVDRSKAILEGLPVSNLSRPRTVSEFISL